MMAEMKAREMQMASAGGENPWEVDYKKEQQDKINEADSSSTMSDNASSMLEKASKSFSF